MDSEVGGAGWGYTVLKPAISEANLKQELKDVMKDACGPVEIDCHRSDFIGARSLSSCSAELVGVLELLWYFLWDSANGTLAEHKDDEGIINIIVYVDSLLVKHVVRGKVVVTSHPFLVTLIQHIWG